MSIKISGRFEMQPKWNFMWTELVFTPVWNLKPVWVHFSSHVNVLYEKQISFLSYLWVLYILTVIIFVDQINDFLHELIHYQLGI